MSKNYNNNELLCRLYFLLVFHEKVRDQFFKHTFRCATTDPVHL